MKKYILFLIVTLAFQTAYSKEVKCETIKNIKSIESKGKMIHFFIDFNKNIIIIKNLPISRQMPIGMLRLEFEEEYSVPIIKKTVKPNNKIIISGSDYYDGIGTEIKITFRTDINKAEIDIDCYFEDISLGYILQRLPINIVNK